MVPLAARRAVVYIPVLAKNQNDTRARHMARAPGGERGSRVAVSETRIDHALHGRARRAGPRGDRGPRLRAATALHYHVHYSRSYIHTAHGAARSRATKPPNTAVQYSISIRLPYGGLPRRGRPDPEASGEARTEGILVFSIYFVFTTEHHMRLDLFLGFGMTIYVKREETLFYSGFCWHIRAVG